MKTLAARHGDQRIAVSNAFLRQRSSQALTDAVVGLIGVTTKLNG